MRKNGHVLRSLDFETEGQRKKRRPKKMWKKKVEEKSMKVGLSMEDAPRISKWIVGD